MGVMELITKAGTLAPRARVDTDTPWHRFVDELEVAMMGLPAGDCPVQDHFVPGWYIRTIFMPAGVHLTSKIHRTRHTFHITKGVVDVAYEDGSVVRYTAPACGVTEPGTRRVLRIIEDCTWTTFHPNPWGYTTVEEMEAEIIERHDAHRAGLVQPRSLE